MLDRTTPPPIRQLSEFSITRPDRRTMKNGMPLNIIHAGTEDVVRFDLLIGGGQWNQEQPLQAMFANRMLREGAGNLTSSQIAERLDYYGAWLELSSSVNYGFITLYSLNKYFARTLPKEYAESETPVLCEAKRWLDIYFSGREPDFTPPLHPVGSAFQQVVWALLLEIPYGETTTYGTLARKLAEKQGLTHMSAQAVGGAVGHNDISLIIPCHRVVGANGSLTGYAGGVDKKIKLLELERADMKSFFVPKKGTAL